MSAAIIRVGSARQQWWLEHMRGLVPELEWRPWDEPGERAEVEYAVVWRPPPGGLRTFPNLRCIVSIGAGVDHVLADPELPRHVPILRTTGPELRQRMREYVALHVLRLHRRLPEIEAGQASCAWRQPVTPIAPGRAVGIMGLGNLGAECARMLAALGFEVAGWARTTKSIEGVACFAGADQLRPFLARTEILVNLLPLTPLTRGILDAALFARLPAGASIINCARGEHLVEADLLAALDVGQIAWATLDVFEDEPLPEDHPFWAHPRVLVTCHTASLIDPETGGRLIADNLRRFMAGLPVPDLVDARRGY